VYPRITDDPLLVVGHLILIYLFVISLLYTMRMFDSFRYSRQATEMVVPDALKQKLPLIFLDGELW
jgi:hypothetical protein